MSFVTEIILNVLWALQQIDLQDKSKALRKRYICHPLHQTLFFLLRLEILQLSEIKGESKAFQTHFGLLPRGLPKS